MIPLLDFISQRRSPILAKKKPNRFQVIAFCFKGNNKSCYVAHVNFSSSTLFKDIGKCFYWLHRYQFYRIVFNFYSIALPCATSQRSENMSAWGRREIRQITNSMYTMSSQRPYSVHTTFPQHLYSVHDASTARKKLLQRVQGALTERTHRAYSVLTAIIALKIVLRFSFFEHPYFAYIVLYFDFSKQFFIVFNSR